ncbi:MAG: cytidine deaminase [Candidatus Nanohaloarchaea archaeon]|jgi:cytidine deaminase
MENITEDEKENLIEEAEKVRGNSFSLYHESSVGAAILTDSGKIFSTPYVESAIQGMGTCAERNAIGSAVADGEYVFKAVAVISDSEDVIKPCGACLQMLYEFKAVAEHDIDVIMAGQNAETEVSTVEELLPTGFTGDYRVDLDRYRD